MKLNSKINTIVIENDRFSQDYIATILIGAFPNINILAFSSNIVDSVRLIEKYKPELILMDIVLDDGLSFEIFESLSFKDFEVIFVTGHNDYIQNAIDHFAFSYVVKPIVPEKLTNAVGRYISLKKRMFSMRKYSSFEKFIKADDAFILIQVSDQYISVQVNAIVKLIADGNYTFFHMKDQERYHVSNSLKYYEKLLQHKGFFRVNRSTMINISAIKVINRKESIVLKNGDCLTISTRNKSNVGELISVLS